MNFDFTISTSKVAAALARFQSKDPSVERPQRLRTHLHALAEDCFNNGPNLVASSEILPFLFDGKDLDLVSFGLGARDRVFAENLIRLKPVIMSSGKLRPSARAIKQSLENEDCLADGGDEWSMFRVLNLAVMGSIPARKKVAIVTSVRNEGLSILEWLAHHRACGIEDFFVYTNDNTDGSNVLLQTLADFGVVSLIQNNVANGVKIQTKILEHSLQLLPELRDFEWVFYIDVDEFFISRCEPGLTIDSFFHDFKSAFPNQSPSAISFNWKWFGSENAFEMTSGLLLERFVHSIHNKHVKSLVRLKNVVSMHRVHAPILVENAWLVNSELQRVDPAIQMRATYGKGQLNHYWNKSFEEFVLKRARGRISQGLDSGRLDYSSFFDWGANGRRGNLDPPPGEIIQRTKQEYNVLLHIPGVDNELQLVRSSFKRSLEEMNRDSNLIEIYKTRGQPQ